jgi:hypothetical protein
VDGGHRSGAELPQWRELATKHSAGAPVREVDFVLLLPRFIRLSQAGIDS